ncbi:class I SAM-dependent methyltransferase [Brevundimonas sp.]|jgi:hypothetical protein|uniref:class I SAM-dependent methyltransferase n=1 Tax=Brevundimonas sp. TaxID=1871086 RepID=UPI00391C48F3|nr:class I SAM-dependent methyltransferase [Brevundimonas sp.]MCA3719101.1 class I SAM-dependent methyltransferase [Brevundimonas sp.]
MTDPADRTIGLYDDKAEGWIADRGPALGGSGKSIDEVEALERFAAALPKGGTVLDVGCGSGWPWGAALLDRGFRVTGIDAAPRLVDHAAQTLPDGEWVVDDMRSVDLGRTFEGLLIWPSMFHLTLGDQSRAIERILAHSYASSVLMMTIPAEASVSIGAWSGEPLFHASLGAPLYMDTLAKAGFTQVQLDSGTTSERASAWMFRRRSVKPTS